MCKRVAMKKTKVFFLLFFVSLVNLFGVENPYHNLSAEEKLNIMINYFINEELRALKPSLPQKEQLKDDDANLDPIKYEQYFNYIQRLKAIRESREAEQKKIDEKYQGQIAFYNGKIKALQRAYTKEENFLPLLAQSINKAFKVVYGTPTLQNLTYDEKNQIVQGELVALDIYKIEKFTPKNITFEMSKEDFQRFMKQDEALEVRVVFSYSNNLLNYESIIFTYNNRVYHGSFGKDFNKAVKLNIKMNDDIFRLEKIE